MNYRLLSVVQRWVLLYMSHSKMEISIFLCRTALIIQFITPFFVMIYNIKSRFSQESNLYAILVVDMIYTINTVMKLIHLIQWRYFMSLTVTIFVNMAYWACSQRNKSQFRKPFSVCDSDPFLIRKPDFTLCECKALSNQAFETRKNGLFGSWSA